MNEHREHEPAERYAAPIADATGRRFGVAQHPARTAARVARAAGVAHDLDNALAAIGHYVAAAAAMQADDGAAQDALHGAQRALAHAHDLVAELRRAGAVRRQPVNVADTLAKACELARAGAPAGVEFRVQTVGAPCVIGDPVLIERALVNVLLNAREACGDCGRIDVTATESDDDPPHVLICVTDNGRGACPSTLQSLTTPYVTTKSESEGHGLGLSIVREIAAMHDGAFEIASNVGEGTRVVITLSSAKEPSRPSAPPRVFVAGVTDQAFAVLQGAFAAQGFALERGEARDEPQCWTSDVRDADVVIVDLDNVQENAQLSPCALRRTGCAAPLIALATNMNFDMDKAANEATLVLAKPFPVAELCGIAARLIHGVGGKKPIS